MTDPTAIDPTVESFIARWSSDTSHGGNERANLQMFVLELCALLDLPPPDPAGSGRSDNAYVFERKLIERFADGGQTTRASVCTVHNGRFAAFSGFGGGIKNARAGRALADASLRLLEP